MIILYVGVILYRFKPENIDDAMKIWEEMALPEAKKQQGFVRAEMFADKKTGRAMDIGYWHTQENADNFEKSGAYDLLISALRDFLEVKPQRMQFQKFIEG